MPDGFKGGDKLLAKLAGIAKGLAEGQSLSVGFLETATYPEDQGGGPVAAVAFMDEYGSKNSPPRPFFRQTIAAKSSGWGAALGKNLVATGYDAEKAMTRVGEGIKDQLVSSIASFSTPGNAPSTIAKKGFDKPLVDSGIMQRSVDFEVKK